MSLTLSSRELALLGHALAVTAAPLAYARMSDWRAAMRHAIEPLLGADERGDLHPASIQFLVGGGTAPACISFFHVSEHAQPFDLRAVAILELVRPVFRASVELLTGLDGTRRGPVFSELVDALPDAAALCAASGQLLHESPSLMRLLAAEPRAASVRVAIAAVAQTLAGHAANGGSEVRGARRRYAVRGSLLATAPAAALGAATIVLVRAAPPRALSDAELRDRFALTSREIEVLRLLTVGRSARDVAATLGISYYTARHHVEHVLAKLGVRTRAAVAAAIAAVGDD
jgi:DNA-binding CsgD family transcriptional regulator